MMLGFLIGLRVYVFKVFLMDVEVPKPYTSNPQTLNPTPLNPDPGFNLRLWGFSLGEFGVFQASEASEPECNVDTSVITNNIASQFSFQNCSICSLRSLFS